MPHEKSKREFTPREFQEIKELISQLEHANEKEQKNLRNKIRRRGLYWSEVARQYEYTTANLEKLLASGTLRIVDETKASESSPTLRNTAAAAKTARAEKRRSRADSDEHYVVDLCDEVLGVKAVRQHRFDFLTGDTGQKLPVDAYYESLNLVVEYYESQHTRQTSFFDKRMTASGIPRGEQRKVYDQRRREVLPEHGLKLVVISYTDFGKTKKLKRNREQDLAVVRRMLADLSRA